MCIAQLPQRCHEWRLVFFGSAASNDEIVTPSANLAQATFGFHVTRIDTAKKSPTVLDRPTSIA
jgi:hypothetical protein